jgi:hypothetical protein
MVKMAAVCASGTLATLPHPRYAKDQEKNKSTNVLLGNYLG